MGNDFDYGYTGDQIHDESEEDSQITFIVGDTNFHTKGVAFETQQMREQDRFERFYRSVFIAIERRPTDPNVEKEELNFIAENIFKEALINNPDSYRRLRRWLKQLFSLAPDVFQVCITILKNPSNGLSSEIMSLAEEVRKECEPTDQMAMPLNTYLEKELMDHALPPAESERMRNDLNDLQVAVTAGNVRPVRQLLDDLLTELPGMRQPLRNWLAESADVPAAIKVFARKYLTNTTK